jgi:hypothetical protein
MGLYFEILAVESELICERRGRIQRKAGIHSQWFNHPDAIRVPESVFCGFSNAFRTAYPAFNYYGPTEYKGQATTRLCNELKTRSWADGTGDARGEAEDAIRKILALAELAQANGQSLLVLGI